MNSKGLLAIVTLLMFAVPTYAGATWQDTPPSRTIWDSVRSSSVSSIEYVLTDADQRVVKNAIVRIEAAIKSRGESYRAKIVQQLRNSAKKYPKNPRMAAIVSTTADRVGSSIQPVVQTAKNGWSCGQNVSYGGYSYSTKLMPTGDCWTTVNMKHSPDIGDSWNYGDLKPNLPTNGTGSTYGRLYTWQSAMGLSGYQTVKDPASNTKDVCGMLGDGWSIPSDVQWSSLEKVGATGWTGNKAFWLMSKLPGTYYYNNDKPIPSDDIDYSGEWWTSTTATQYDAYVRYAVNGYTGIDRFYMTYHSWLSVVCVFDKKMSSTATWTTVVTDTSKSKAYTNAELILSNGSKSFSNLDMNGIKAIVADKTTAKLLQPIMAKLQTEFLTICKVGESGIYNTLSCSNEDAVNYVKYLYLSTEAVIEYSSNETDRAYSSGSIYTLRGTLHDMTPNYHYGEGDTMYFGFYGTDGKFNKVKIMVGWEAPESGNSNEKVVVFYASPDAPGFGQQQQYKKLDCIDLFGCKKGDTLYKKSP